MPPRAGPDEDASRHRLQETVGEGYRVEELLGRGGFAEVFAATDLRLGRRVAIKVLRPDLTVSEALLERFQREARAVATLRHPNVMPIYSVGGREGVAFFTMPLIEGESLGARLGREGTLPVEEARRIAVEACRALAAAHAKGLVHRDVKPDNILLEGEERRVLLADFGIAKAVEGDDGQALTGSDHFMGTPRYGSPEQMSGDPLDHRSDLYSLGCVAYRMLAGRPPFEAGTTRRLVVKHLTEAPAPIRSLRAECPEELAAAIERCLAKEPGERWGSAGALGEALASGTPGVIGAAVRGAGGAGQSAVARADDERGLAASGRVGSEGSDPLRSFRRRTAALLVGSAGVLTVELLLGGSGVLGTVALLVSVAVAAAAAGRLWTEGYDPGTLLRGDGAPGASSGSGRRPGDEILFRHGYADIVDDGRRERANVVRLFEAMPRSRREAHPTLVGTVDQLLARLRQRARGLASLESRLEAELAAADRARARTPGEADDGTGARARLGELEGAREAASRELGSILVTLRAIRAALDRVDPAEAEVQERLRAASGLLQGAGASVAQSTERRSAT